MNKITFRYDPMSTEPLSLVRYSRTGDFAILPGEVNSTVVAFE